MTHKDTFWIELLSARREKLYYRRRCRSGEEMTNVFNGFLADVLEHVYVLW